MTTQLEFIGHQRVRSSFFERENTWTINLRGQMRTISAELSGLNGKLHVYVDRQLVYETPWTKLFRFSHDFMIDGVPSSILYYLEDDYTVPHMYLIVDHINVETGRNVGKTTLPIWSWIFAMMCFIIPIMTIGGAIPALIGGLGGIFSLATANRRAESEWVRVVKIIGIVIVTWVVFIMFIYTFSPDAREAFALGFREGVESGLR
ncbi:MAG: hypothetical protein RLP44_00615 [Aggregatilineales bacterium]